MLLVCTMVLSLAACGNNNAGNDPKQTQKPDSSSPATATPAPKPVTLNVTTTYAGNDGNAKNFQEGYKAWETETGNKVNDASATSDETFKARILGDFEAGAEPDVLLFFNGVDSNPFVSAGKVVSVDEIRTVDPTYADNMKDEMLGASPVDGKNYSVPVNGYWEGLFVNKEVLAKAGVEVPTAETTWDEFMTMCQKIKDAGYAPIAASLATIPHYWFEFAIFNNLDVASHFKVPESTTDKQGTGWINGIKDIKDLYDKGFFPENTLTGTDDETFAMFCQDKAAFLIDGSWKMNGILDAVQDPDNFTVTYVPGKGDRKTTDAIGGLSSGYYITKKAWDNPDKRAAAISFVKYMTTDEMVSKFAVTSATALKNGATLDESTLKQIEKDALAMCKGMTGITNAVQDLVPAEARIPVFDGMSNLVTGKADITEAVQQVIDLMPTK